MHSASPSAVRPDTRTPAETALTRTSMFTPVGELTLIASATGLRAIIWDTDDETERVRVDASTVDDDDPVLRLARHQLREYFAGERREFTVPLEPIGTSFQQSAWQVLRGIPYGETINYGQQAKRLGDPNKARAVGAANGRNPLSIVVPCHRVIGANGSLTGFGGGIENKAWLLDHERMVRFRAS